MRAFSVAVLVFILTAVILIKTFPASANVTTSGVAICHSTGTGVYASQVTSSLSVVGSADIVPPTSSQPGKNWDKAHAAIYYFGCKTPPNISRPVPPAIKSGSIPLPLYTGP